MRRPICACCVREMDTHKRVGRRKSVGNMDESQKIRERKKGRGKGVELAPESYHGLIEKIGKRVGGKEDNN